MLTDSGSHRIFSSASHPNTFNLFLLPNKTKAPLNLSLIQNMCEQAEAKCFLSFSLKILAFNREGEKTQKNFVTRQ